MRNFLYVPIAEIELDNRLKKITTGYRRMPSGVYANNNPISGTSAKLKPILNANRSRLLISFAGKSNCNIENPGIINMNAPPTINRIIDQGPEEGLR